MNPDFEALGAFKIDFPDGIEVILDDGKDHGGIQYEWRKGRVVPVLSDMDFSKMIGLFWNLLGAVDAEPVPTSKTAPLGDAVAAAEYNRTFYVCVAVVAAVGVIILALLWLRIQAWKRRRGEGR